MGDGAGGVAGEARGVSGAAEPVEGAHVGEGHDVSDGVEPAVDLLVLAGGRAERLGGADKAALVVGGRSLLDRVLDVELGGRVVVVGDTPVPDGVVRTVEDPPGGGPVAGIAAGLLALDALAAPHPPAWVAICAVDQPGAAAALAALRTELPRVGEFVEALCHVDDTGHLQWLLAIYRRHALDAALERVGEARHTSVRAVVADLHWREVDAGREHLGDVDTWDDLRRWD